MSDKQRELFEEWARQIPLANLNRHLAGYESELINAYWSVWQAAIASVVVELPDAWEDGYDTLMDADMVKKSIDDAGIKWTE